MNDSERLQKVLNYLNVSPYDIAKKLNRNRPQWLYDIIKGKSNITKRTAMEICNLFPIINSMWLLTDEGKMLNINQLKNTESTCHKETHQREAHIKEFPTHIPVKLVTTKARAGYLSAFYANEYLDDMPTVLIESDKEHKGKYLAFEIDGDSMEPIYYKGDVVIGREIPRHLWSSKLHYKEWDFVIAHGTQGILVKEIIDHNVETGEITCHSINTSEYPDFVVNLGEVSYLYNIVESRRSGKNSKMRR